MTTRTCRPDLFVVQLQSKSISAPRRPRGGDEDGDTDDGGGEGEGEDKGGDVGYDEDNTEKPC